MFQYLFFRSDFKGNYFLNGVKLPVKGDRIYPWVSVDREFYDSFCLDDGTRILDLIRDAPNNWYGGESWEGKIEYADPTFTVAPDGPIWVVDTEFKQARMVTFSKTIQTDFTNIFGGFDEICEWFFGRTFSNIEELLVSHLSGDLEERLQFYQGLPLGQVKYISDIVVQSTDMSYIRFLEPGVNIYKSFSYEEAVQLMLRGD